MKRRIVWLRVVFILVLAAGLAGVIGTPLARLALTGIDMSDPVGAALLAMHPSNAWYHPYFYGSLAESFQAAVQALGTTEGPLYMLASGGDFSRTRLQQREQLQRNLAVWAYPRRVRVWCEIVDPSLLPDCNVPPNATVISWGLRALPGRACESFGNAIAVCR